MYTTGTPDLMSNGRASRLLSRIDGDFARAAEEVSTGLKSDPVKASGGDPIRLYALERDLTLNETRRVNLDAAAARAGATQTALSKLETATGAIGGALMGAITIGDMTSAELHAGKARGAFGDAVGALNARYGDRTLFAGAATDGAALAGADRMLAEIAARVAPATGAADVIAAVDDYFSDPAGFAATGYLGSLTDAAAAETGDGERVGYAIRADRAEITDALKALALGVIGAEGGYAGATRGDRMEVMREAAGRGLNAIAGVVALRGEVGVSEERLELAGLRIGAERSFLQQSRNAVIAADPYEAGVAFTALQAQLETALNVTARLSSLSLAKYL
ncbi:MAG: flagellin [Pikeienuella sp.]